MGRPRIVMRPPEARHRAGAGPAGLDRWELSCGDAKAEVYPARGGLVSRFSVGSDEVLYCDRERLGQRGQPPLGGAQVLFPVAGPLTEDRYESGGRSFAMRPGGLARQAPWEVVDVAGARLVMELRSSEATRISYPFAFTVRLVVDLELAGGRGLALEVEIKNQGPEPLPYQLGLMPHLLVLQAQKAETVLETPALQAQDEVAGAPLALPAPGEVDLAASEVDLCLLDHVRPRGGLSTLRVRVPERSPRVLSFSETLPCVAVQTLAFKDYVAVGPWTARRDALRTGVGLRTVAVGAAVSYTLTVTV